MIGDPARYDLDGTVCDSREHNCCAQMKEMPVGSYVNWEDFEAIRVERDELASRVGELEDQRSARLDGI